MKNAIASAEGALFLMEEAVTKQSVGEAKEMAEMLRRSLNELKDHTRRLEARR